MLIKILRYLAAKQEIATSRFALLAMTCKFESRLRRFQQLNKPKFDLHCSYHKSRPFSRAAHCF